MSNEMRFGSLILHETKANQLRTIVRAVEKLIGHQTTLNSAYGEESMCDKHFSVGPLIVRMRMGVFGAKLASGESYKSLDPDDERQLESALRELLLSSECIENKGNSVE